MPNWFRVSIRYGNAACVVSCAGEMDSTTSERVAEAAALCLERGSALIMLDLHGVTFIDSTGVQALIRVARRCRETGTGFTLAPSPRVRAVAQRLGVAEMLGLGDRAPGALVPMEPAERTAG